MDIKLLKLGPGDKITVFEGGAELETEITLREPPEEKADGTFVYHHEGGAKIVLGEHDIMVDGRRFRRVPLRGMTEI